MDPYPVVVEFDVVEQVPFQILQTAIELSVDTFFLQLREKTFDARIVVQASRPRHAADNPRSARAFWNPAFAYWYPRSLWIMVRSYPDNAHRFPKCPLDQFQVDSSAHRLNVDLADEQVNHYGRVDPSDLRPNVRDVSDPHDIRGTHGEILLRHVVLMITVKQILDIRLRIEAM